MILRSVTCSRMHVLEHVTLRKGTVRYLGENRRHSGDTFFSPGGEPGRVDTLDIYNFAM